MRKRVGKNISKLGSLFLAHDEKIITILTFTLVYGFLFLMLDVGSVFTNTHITGGDTGSHLYIPEYLKQIFPLVKWWSPDWYSGFPFLYFYPPFMYFVTVILSFIIPINIAFKLVIFSGVLIFPLSFYLSLKWLGMKFPIPQLGVVFGLLLLFLEKYTIYGGNLASLLAGQFSHTMSISLLFMFVGLMYKGIKENKYLVWNTTLGAAIILTHPISGILLILLFLIFPFQGKNIKQNFVYTLSIYIGTFLLSAFWTLGLVWYGGYSGKMNWGQNVSLGEIFPPHLLFWCIAAVFGILLVIFQKERKLLGFLWLLWFSLLLYLFLDGSSVWNTRFLPYISYIMLILSAYFIGSVLSYLKKNHHTVMIVLLFSIVFFSFYTVKQNTKVASGWFKWNFTGYETKDSWQEADGLFKYLQTLPKGRVMWEYRPEYEKYGTPRVLETVPTFSSQPTYEGLLIESGITGPFHFTNQAETTDKPTSAIAGFTYPSFDFEKGVKHLKMSGAKYFVAYTDMVKEKANNNADLIKIKESGPFNIYEFRQSDMVESIKNFEVQEKDKGWMQRSFEWYKDANPEKPIVFVRNNKEKSSLENTKGNPDAKIPENVTQTKDSIEFNVEDVGTPYLVKIAYFPTWRVKGAKGPYLVSPAYMMVVPTEKHVRLYFAYGWIDWIGIFLSFVGIGYLFFMKRVQDILRSVTDRINLDLLKRFRH